MENFATSPPLKRSTAVPNTTSELVAPHQATPQPQRLLPQATPQRFLPQTSGRARTPVRTTPGTPQRRSFTIPKVHLAEELPSAEAIMHMTENGLKGLCLQLDIATSTTRNMKIAISVIFFQAKRMRAHEKDPHHPRPAHIGREEVDKIAENCKKEALMANARFSFKGLKAPNQ